MSYLAAYVWSVTPSDLRNPLPLLHFLRSNRPTDLKIDCLYKPLWQTYMNGNWSAVRMILDKASQRRVLTLPYNKQMWSGNRAMKGDHIRISRKCNTWRPSQAEGYQSDGRTVVHNKQGNGTSSFMLSGCPDKIDLLKKHFLDEWKDIAVYSIMRFFNSAPMKNMLLHYVSSDARISPESVSSLCTLQDRGSRELLISCQTSFRGSSVS